MGPTVFPSGKIGCFDGNVGARAAWKSLADVAPCATLLQTSGKVEPRRGSKAQEGQGRHQWRETGIGDGPHCSVEQSPEGEKRAIVQASAGRKGAGQHHEGRQAAVTRYGYRAMKVLRGVEALRGRSSCTCQVTDGERIRETRRTLRPVARCNRLAGHLRSKPSRWRKTTRAEQGSWSSRPDSPKGSLEALGVDASVYIGGRERNPKGGDRYSHRSGPCVQQDCVVVLTPMNTGRHHTKPLLRSRPCGICSPCGGWNRGRRKLRLWSVSQHFGAEGRRIAEGGLRA